MGLRACLQQRVSLGRRWAAAALAGGLAVAGAAGPVAADAWGTTVRRAPAPPPPPRDQQEIAQDFVDDVAFRSGVSLRDDLGPIRRRRILMARRRFLEGPSMAPYMGAGVVTKRSVRVKGAAAAMVGGVERRFIGASVLFGEAQQRVDLDGDIETMLWIGLRHGED